MEVEVKRKILFWVAVAAGTILVGLIVWYFSYVGQFHRYRDDLYKFSIKFPKNWAYKVHPQPNGAIVFMAPKERPMDDFTATINVAVEPLAANIANLRDLNETIKKQMEAVFNNIKLAESVPVKMGDRKAWKMVFVAERPDEITIMSAWTIRDAEKAYIITYMTKTKSYQKYLPLVEGMMKSFKLNK